MKNIGLICAIILCVKPIAFSQKDLLISKINELIAPFPGKVGLSVKLVNSSEKISINASKPFPMQSVYKFPLAVAVFQQIDKGKYSLDQTFNLKKSDLLPNTHSPLREKYPEGKAAISLQELLEKTVSESDNNGCDYLFRLMGGCKAVHGMIAKYQPKGINIAFTEEEMHHDSLAQYTNYAQPLAMTAFLEKFYQSKILSKQSTQALWKMMVETSTAPNRMKGLLPAGTVVGHKSGWSGGDDRGFTNAINDVGIIILPNGKALAISIFISDTTVKSTESDKLAAKITKLVYDYFIQKV